MKRDGKDDLVRDLLMEDEGTMVNSLGRWLPTVVVIGALAGFIGLAWYAYRTGTQSLKEEDLVVVEADHTPMKEKPLDPGGMKFPNQDKTVFEAFAGGGQAPPKVEKLLPSPEEPMARSMDTSGTQTWVNDKLYHTDNNAANPEQVIGADKTSPGTALDSAMTEEKAAPKEPPSPAAGSEVAAEPAPRKSAPAADDGFKVQLGAYRSNKEAIGAWKKMKGKYPELSDRTPLVVKADLGAKGVYYRLRVGGFSGREEAAVLCTALTSRGQPCMAVKE